MFNLVPELHRDGRWLYETAGGIQPDPTEGGYRKIVLKPRPGGGLTFAETSYETLYGELNLNRCEGVGAWFRRIFLHL